MFPKADGFAVLPNHVNYVQALRSAPNPWERLMDSAITLNAGCVPNLYSDGRSSDNRTFCAGSPILEWGCDAFSFSARIPQALFLPSGQDWFHYLAGSDGQEFSCAPQINRQPTVANELTS